MTDESNFSTFDDFMATTERNVLLSTNCHAIGVVESFDQTTQLARVSIVYKRNVNGESIDYPAIVDCPIVILGGGDARLEFPIVKGDTGLLCFNDRDIDDWLTTGQLGREPATARLHAFTDAILIIGVRPMTKPISDYSATKARFRNGTTVIELGTKIHVANTVTDLLTVLTGLINHLVTGMSTPTPSPGTAFNPAVATALSTDLVLLQGLLE